MIERCDKIVAAGGAINIFIHAHKHAFDLFIQFGAVSHNQHAGVWHIFTDPLRQPDHRQAFTRSLCVPDNTAFTTGNMLFSRLDAEELIMAAEFFHPDIKGNVIMDDIQQPGFATQTT